jgi:hypothetical protein
MGHSSIATTFDVYGHLLPGSTEEVAGLVDTYLDRVDPEVQLHPVIAFRCLDPADSARPHQAADERPPQLLMRPLS